ncbi:methyltransferase domain-containing protein [Candidatus Gracilibacteria bacterium]|nr:methyltransferase domain-containing protein [Candidatus Gracilibacteria bacterium]
MALLLGFATLCVLALLTYWLLFVGELTYFGPRAVRLLYHFGAPHYDAVRHALAAHDDAVLKPLLLSFVVRYPVPSVLDVATGTGRVPLLLAATPIFTGHVVGLDLTPAMLARAQARQQEREVSSVSWIVGRAEQLRWPDESFDLVTCLEALEFFRATAACPGRDGACLAARRYLYCQQIPRSLGAALARAGV